MSMNPATAAQVAQMVAAHGLEKPKGGVVADGSWNAAEGTFTAIDGESFSAFDDDVPLPIPNVPMALPSVDVQFSPLPGDRVILTNTRGGYVAQTHVGPDDALNVPPGEGRIRIRSATNPTTVLGLLKFAQNGAQANDGAGGFSWVGGSLVSAVTAGGLTISANDHTKQIILGVPGGLEVIVDINAGTVSIGGTGLTQTQNGLVRQSDLQAALNSQNGKTQTAINTLAATVQPGSGVAPPTIASTTATSSPTVLSK
jgi:hypothetical protein